MKVKRVSCRILGILVFYFMIIIISLTARPVRADIAPPDFPSGAGIAPEGEGTMVRMMAEKVVLKLLSAASPYAPVSPAMAHTTADFTMQNQGSVAETMWVRFPLTYWSWHGDPYNQNLEIRDFTVKVNGTEVPYKRVMEVDPYNSDISTPWAEFLVTFPPGEPVGISVSYQSDATGELAYAVFRYTLETGTGWYDTIGSADITVRLPYDASMENVVFDTWTGFGEPTPGATFEGNEAHWHFDDLEPEYQNNFMAILLTPAAWKKVLQERQNTTTNPNDGEAWGRLGKACKEAIYLRKGMRNDPGGLALYQEAVEAYEKALELLPNDSLWHYGYADLLWSQYYWNVYWNDPTDVTLLVKAVQHLQTALQIDPNNLKAKDLLDNISYSVPEYVGRTESGVVDLLVLTATPEHVTHTPWPSETPVASETPIPTETQPPGATLPPSKTPSPPKFTMTPISSATAQPEQTLPTSFVPPATQAASGQGGLQICSVSVFLLPAILCTVWVSRKRVR
jgi:hypothetical protein